MKIALKKKSLIIFPDEQFFQINVDLAEFKDITEKIHTDNEDIVPPNDHILRRAELFPYHLHCNRYFMMIMRTLTIMMITSIMVIITTTTMQSKIISIDTPPVIIVIEEEELVVRRPQKNKRHD